METILLENQYKPMMKFMVSQKKYLSSLGVKEKRETVCVTQVWRNKADYYSVSNRFVVRFV